MPCSRRSRSEPVGEPGERVRGWPGTSSCSAARRVVMSSAATHAVPPGGRAQPAEAGVHPAGVVGVDPQLEADVLVGEPDSAAAAAATSSRSSMWIGASQPCSSSAAPCHPEELGGRGVGVDDRAVLVGRQDPGGQGVGERGHAGSGEPRPWSTVGSRQVQGETAERRSDRPSRAGRRDAPTVRRGGGPGSPRPGVTPVPGRPGLPEERRDHAAVPGVGEIGEEPAPEVGRGRVAEGEQRLDHARGCARRRTGPAGFPGAQGGPAGGPSAWCPDIQRRYPGHRPVPPSARPLRAIS